MSTGPTSFQDCQRLSEMFHEGRPAGTVTKRIRLEVKTPHNAQVLHVFEDDVPFDHWLVAQYPRLKIALSSACNLRAVTSLSGKGLTPVHYGVLVGMSPEELTTLVGKCWSLPAPWPGVPSDLQLALALGRPELAKCLVTTVYTRMAPQSCCQLETLYPASDMDAYALALCRLREEDGALKEAYNAAVTKIEGEWHCLRDPIDMARSRRHNLLAVLPYLLLVVLLSSVQTFLFHRPVHHILLAIKEGVMDRCNGDEFACTKAVDVGVVDPLTMCGNTSHQSPCLYQRYVTHTALAATVDPFKCRRKPVVGPRSWEFLTCESKADWQCRFDTVVTQRPSSPARYSHTVVCSAPVEFMSALLLLTVMAAAGVFASLLRDLGAWRRGSLYPVWRDRVRFWVSVVSDIIVCVAGGILTLSLWHRGEAPAIGVVAFGWLASAATVLCLPKCFYNFSTIYPSKVEIVLCFAYALGSLEFVIVMLREPIALFLCFLLGHYATPGALAEARRRPEVWQEHRIAYLEEALADDPPMNVSLFEFKFVRWGCYCAVVLCLAVLALDLYDMYERHVSNPMRD